MASYPQKNPVFLQFLINIEVFLFIHIVSTTGWG